MTSVDFSSYYQGLVDITGNSAFEQWRNTLPELIASILNPSQHGDLSTWYHTLIQLPRSTISTEEFSTQVVKLGTSKAPDQTGSDQLRSLFMQLKPWRKGPYEICDQYIDSEWRSDLKWDRLSGQIDSLQGKLVLDVGCGNGYHCWRMFGAGARAVIGIDPTLLYIMQYCAVQHFARNNQVFVLPITLEAMPDNLESFDTVFSMGVLYHRRSPLDHLLSLRSCLNSGGQLILETLIVENDHVLVPNDRYAGMKNVWFIPSCNMLSVWLARCGFKDIRLLDVARTLPVEQRVTSWTGDVSLVDFLHPKDSAKTIEGHPAPVRAIFTARR